MLHTDSFHLAIGTEYLLQELVSQKKGCCLVDFLLFEYGINLLTPSWRSNVGVR